MVLGFWAIPKDERSTEADKRVDWLGAFLVTVGLTLIRVVVLSDGEVAPNKWATSCKLDHVSLTRSLCLHLI